MHQGIPFVEVGSEPVTVIVPALNEETSIGAVVDQIREALSNAGVSHQVLVVDDGSTDRTAEMARAHGAHVLRHRQNLGYGRSLKDGIQVAEHDLIAITDADATYPLERLPELIELAGDYHMVVGQRTGRIYSGGVWKRLARVCFRLLGEFATGRRIPDINSGFRVFRRRQVLPFLPAVGSGYSFTTSITLLYLLNDLFVHYVPVAYHPRKGRSKVRLLRDTLRATQIVVEAILRYNPVKVFLLLASPLLLAGMVAAVVAVAARSGLAAILAAVFLSASAGILALGFAAVTLAPPRSQASRTEGFSVPPAEEGRDASGQPLGAETMLDEPTTVE